MPTIPANSRARNTFRALRSRNYRLYFAGQGISLVGTWMERVAIGWFAWRITGSEWLVGLIGFTTWIPNFVLAPVAGVVADSFDRMRILYVMQVCAMIQAGVMAWLTLTGRCEVWHLFVLGGALGVITAFDLPARQAFLIQLVDKEHLSNAIALNSSLVNLARLIGPSLAGIMIDRWSVGVVFLGNAVSYVGVLGAMAAMRLPPMVLKKNMQSKLGGMAEGFRYVVRNPAIRTAMLLMTVVSLAAMPYNILMPILADKTLGGGARTLGILMGGTGAGALAGAVWLAGRRDATGLGRVAWRACAGMGFLLILVGISRDVHVTFCLLTLMGACMIVNLASCNTIVQSVVEEGQRGRVMSYYLMSFTGMIPFGQLIAGGTAHWIGVPNTLVIGGICTCVGAATVGRRLSAVNLPVHAEPKGETGRML